VYIKASETCAPLAFSTRPCSHHILIIQFFRSQLFPAMSSRKRTVALEIKLKNQQLKMVQYVPSIFRGVSARGVSLPAPFQQMTAHGPNNLERWSIYTATFLKKFGSLHGKQSTGTAVLQESEEEKKKKQASPRSRRSRICLSLLTPSHCWLLKAQSQERSLATSLSLRRGAASLSQSARKEIPSRRYNIKFCFI
jgi:hypothetical protein